MLDELTSAQISEWEVYNSIDPIGKWRDELAIASLASVIVNMMRDYLHDPKKGKVEHLTPADFLIKWGEIETLNMSPKDPKPGKKQSGEDMVQTMLGIARMQGQTDKIEKK